MATDATGTPTSLSIPKYDTNVDAPSGLGFNAAMDAINALLVANAAAVATNASNISALQAAIGILQATTVARAHVGSAQTLSSATWTKINLSVLDFDPGSHFDLTNHYYVVPSTGYYHVSGQLSFTVENNPQRGLSAVYLNDTTEISRGVDVPIVGASIASDTIGSVVTDIVHVSGGDHLSLFGRQEGGSMGVQIQEPFAQLNFLSVVRVA